MFLTVVLVSCSTISILFVAAVYSARQSNEAEIKRLKASFNYFIIQLFNYIKLFSIKAFKVVL